MSASIFISYSSSDQKVAETICDALQARGFTCWISCRDIGPGENFQEAIVQAIRSVKLMLLVFTSNANNSNEIKKEIVLAGRYHLTVVPVRVEDVAPNDALAYEFATRQWIDLFKDWEHDIERLASQIGSLLAEGPAVVGSKAPVAKKPLLQRYALVALFVSVLAIGGAYLYWRLAIPSAQMAADDRAWSDAANLGTVQGFKQYLDSFRNGGHVAEAQQRIQAIDDKAWTDAFAAGNIVALSKYLLQFPEGAHAAQAQRSITGLERQAAEPGHAPDKTHFDGSWLITIACSDAGGAKGYSMQIPSEVKDGVFHGQRGSEGQPNWLTVDGTIQLDGSTELFVQGVTSVPAYTVGNLPTGSNYSYHLVARFEDASAKGTRQELRPCNFTAVKR